MTRGLGWTAMAATGVAILTLGTADTAQAHVCLEYPMSRVGPECSPRSPQKVGPCGIAERSEYRTEFRPGETIVVELNETIDHPSHYRISFNPDGDAFEDPVAIDDDDGSHPHVLLDGIQDEDAARQMVEVTLPEVECDECTLQLIQVMYDKQGNGFGGNDGLGDDDNDDIYYACADLVLSDDETAGAASGAAIDPGSDVAADAAETPRRDGNDPSLTDHEKAWSGRGELARAIRATRRSSEPLDGDGERARGAAHADRHGAKQ